MVSISFPPWVKKEENIKVKQVAELLVNVSVMAQLSV